MIDDRDRQRPPVAYTQAGGSRICLFLDGGPSFEEGASERCDNSIGRQHEALLLHRASGQCDLQQGAGKHSMPSATIEERFVWTISC